MSQFFITCYDDGKKNKKKKKKTKFGCTEKTSKRHFILLHIHIYTRVSNDIFILYN